MKPSLPWLLLVFAVMGGASTPEPSIRITCSEDYNCSAVPPSLAVQNLKKVLIDSPQQWTCQLYDPGAKFSETDATDCPRAVEDPGTVGQNPALVFTLQEQPVEKIVVPLLLPPPKSPPHASLALPLIASLLAILSAGLGLFLWLNAGTAPDLVQANQRCLRDLEYAQSTIRRISDSLQFEDLPRREPGRGDELAPSPYSSPAAPDLFNVDYANIMSRVNAWVRLAPTQPNEIRKQTDILTLTGPSIPLRDLENIAQIIGQVAVRSTDDIVEATGDDSRLEDALRQLLQACGLSLIEPQPGEAFDDARHLTTGATWDAPRTQLRGRVAKVRRRGLERQGRVIARAEVILFD